MAEESVPAVALRTYRFLRLTVIGVIAMLAISILIEAQRTDWCLKGSISAYYYSPVRSVFVGALCAIGLVLIALWGKTAIEDSLFNLAGLLAPVVAFVPAKDDGLCPADPALDPVRNQAAIANAMWSYLVVVGLFLAALVVVGVIARRQDRWPLIRDNQVGFWVPLGLAIALWLLGLWQFSVRDRTPGGASWFYQNVHFTSAIVMFVLITLGILWIGIAWWFGRRRLRAGGRLATAFNACLGEIALSEERDPKRARRYVGQALAMLGVSVLLFVPGTMGAGPTWFVDHYVFLVEAWMIGNVAVFWAVQTKERWHEGAPPRTEEELAAAVETDARRSEAEARAGGPQ
ncbi:hypothetical protein [Nocardioides sp. SR21]|uniref:hypothetical protein n=1 Tax=Nocardioides sp. SR21 TaxID=2919501 RepID=UPI001FAA474F|nr:hypothetical protein [Nocardioides sp. SR21]